MLSHKLCGGVQPLPLKLSCLLAPAQAEEMLGCGRLWLGKEKQTFLMSLWLQKFPVAGWAVLEGNKLTGRICFSLGLVPGGIKTLAWI